MRVPNLHTAPKRHLIKIRTFLKVLLKRNLGIRFFPSSNSLIFADQFGIYFIKIEEWEHG